MPVTLTLGLTGLVIALLVSLPLGILAAVRENTALDRVVQMVALLGQAMPSFWLGLILMITFGLQLGWLPISGTGSWQHYVMPGIVLAFSAIPALTRLTRAGMIQAMGSDYIRTARAKGLSRASILLKHALRNAAIPVVAIAAVQLGFMLGGSIVIEQVFALHGVGFLAWESIGKNDFPVVQAVVLVLAVIYVALTMLADLMNAVLDPRLRGHECDDGHGRPQARLEERQHLDRRGHRGHRGDLRPRSRRCSCRTIRSPRTSASACCRRSGWRAPTPAICSAPTSSAATTSRA